VTGWTVPQEPRRGSTGNRDRSRDGGGGGWLPPVDVILLICCLNCPPDVGGAKGTEWRPPNVDGAAWCQGVRHPNAKSPWSVGMGTTGGRGLVLGSNFSQWHDSRWFE